jgi:HD superfamily phosphodiesterase
MSQFDPSPIIAFVKQHTGHFDSSHDINHVIAVYEKTIEILDSYDIEYDKKLVSLASLLHDICDSKYKSEPDSISEDELREFIQGYYENDLTSVHMIMDIIDNISFSKEKKNGKIKAFDYPYNLYRDAISDADKLEALGIRGIDRCIAYTESHGGKVPDDVIQHCNDKLFILADQYIRTNLGKEYAKILETEMREYLRDKFGV